MVITQKEESTIGVLYRFFHKHRHDVIEVEFNHEPKYQAIMDTAYDTDNGLEMDEEGYEEFAAILLKRLDNDELVELSYHHFPKRITCNGEFVAGTDSTI